VTHENLTEYIVAARLWGDSDICLIDVGASGGIDRRWSVFGDRLTAVGFDPLISEVERLNATETQSKVRYESALVGCLDYDRLFPPEIRNDRIASRFNQPFERSSAVAAYNILKRDYVRDVFNSGAPVEYSSRTITLDDYLASNPQLRPDFLKVDTDGSDYPVLLGAAALIESDHLLGIAIECQFQGAVHEFANGFANIDRFLRARGFTLFDLDPYRYSRASLPSPFAIGIPAQTTSGQVNWGEAVYFRDLGHALYETQFGVAPTRERLLKLCCLFERFGLNDCAAEILASSEVLAALPERTALLDLLTPDTFGDTRYDDYIARFNAGPLAWLPQNIERHRQPETAAPVADAPSLDVASEPSVDAVPEPGPHEDLRRDNERLRETVTKLKERVQWLKEQRSELRDRLRRREERLEMLRTQKLQKHPD
jgi:FkbM family methyltransferase